LDPTNMTYNIHFVFECGPKICFTCNYADLPISERGANSVCVGNH
jgi:hypothetical protein